MTKVLAEISGLRSDTYVKNTRETKIMKNDSTSDQVINTTATDICDVLKNLSAGKHTIKINGKINNETLNAINKTLQDLNNPDTLINLDLSNVTCLTSIGNGAFCDCESLTSVIIPNSVTSIGNFAFFRCESLTSVTIPNSVISIGDKAFSVCESLIVFDVSANNKNYSSSDDGKILYNKDKTKLIAYPTATGDVTILDSVTSIGDDAFCGCDSLTSVTIPNSVTSIGTGAFWGCKSLTNVIIPDSVTSIGGWAFCDCESLTSVIIPNSVTSIGDNAFCYCDSLTSVIIPDSVTFHRRQCFLRLRKFNKCNNSKQRD